MGKENRPCRLLNIFTINLCLLLLFQTASCGWIIYPDRRHSQVQINPSGRRIDPAVAVMDAVWLIFFIIPGVVAFAVDFGTGAIYLPGGRRASLEPGEGATELSLKRIIHLKREEMVPITLEQVISRETGVMVRFSDPNMQAYHLDRIEDIDKKYFPSPGGWGSRGGG